MNLFSVRNPIFEIPRAQRRQNDKFVTVGIPEAETNANLILLGFQVVPPYPGPKKPLNHDFKLYKV